MAAARHGCRYTNAWKCWSKRRSERASVSYTDAQRVSLAGLFVGPPHWRIVGFQPELMIQDTEMTRAVAAIPQRSERQQDPEKLVVAFVDVGILSQIDNNNNQILYGRRGTGKTHVLRVLGSKLSASGRPNIVAYIDARTLGSTAQFSDETVPMSTRCTSLFRDFLGEIHNALLDFVVTLPTDVADSALENLSELGRLVTEPFLTVSLDKAADKETLQASSSRGASASVQANAAQASLNASVSAQRSAISEKTTEFSVRNEDKLIFPAVSARLKTILTQCRAQLYILVDEWSSLPNAVQPFLAEFFKRSFLPLPQITVKIASLEHRSTFRSESKIGQIGFELGADISAGIDIDDYYVFDRNPERITEAFGDMLVGHIRNELPPDALSTKFGISNGKELASKLFTERVVFQELVRASEGVARDLINIFTMAFFLAHRKGREKVERGFVLEAARQWFEQDKAGNLDSQLQAVLRRITDEVIGKRRARSFLLLRELGDHPVVQRLVDLRVLHLVRRGYADKDKPGVRYNIYSLDYGTYVDLMNTSKRPDLGFEVAAENGHGEDFVVPFDDKRSIRRINLTREILEEPPTRE